MSLIPVIIRAPGIGGLNLEGEDIRPDATFADIAENCVFDEAGRIASRKGYASIATEITGAYDVESIFVYNDAGTEYVIVGVDGDLYYDDIPTGTPADITGSITASSANWQFTNFDGDAGTIVVGALDGNTLIYWDGDPSATFVEVTASASGTVPDGNCVHAAFGRLWASRSDGTTVAYSGLLDETQWESPGSGGEINVLGNEAAVRDGYDTITAISHLDDKLVVFLNDSILIYDGAEDPGGSGFGIYKTLSNVGCVARDSVQEVGDDLVFLSRQGLMSLRRAVVEDELPLRDYSKPVRTQLLLDVENTFDEVDSVFYENEGQYLLRTASGYIWCFDFKRILSDGAPRITRWYQPDWKSFYFYQGTLYIGALGEYGEYTGYQDDGESYPMRYRSVKVDFESPGLKIAKQSNCVLRGAGGQTLQFEYRYEFGLDTQFASVAVPQAENLAEFTAGATTSENEFNTAEFGDGTGVAEVKVYPGGSGEVVQVGFSTDVDGALVAVEQLSHYFKAGRLGR